MIAGLPEADTEDEPSEGAAGDIEDEPCIAEPGDADDPTQLYDPLPGFESFSG